MSAFDSDFFAADFDLIRAVGRVRRLKDFDTEAHAFAHHPANRGILRKKGRIRVSTKRLRSLMRETMAAAQKQ